MYNFRIHAILLPSMVYRLGVIHIYNIKMVSKLLNIPTVTIRAWENRYHIIDPVRDENGHRLYSDQDVKDLEWLLEQTKVHGMSIKHAAKKLEDQRKRQDEKFEVVEAQIELPHDAMYGGVYETQHEAQLRQKLYEALLEVNPLEANRYIDMGFSMYDFDRMLQYIIVPTLVKVGDDWESGKISVAQEHFSTELIKHRLFQFLRLFQQSAHYPRMIAACPSNERHEVGLLIFTLFLRRKGVDIVYLGSDMPVEGLIEIQARLNINYVLLSASDRTRLNEHMNYMTQVISVNNNTKFIVGGPGFSHLKTKDLPITHLTGNVADWNNWFDHAFAVRSYE